MNQKEYYFFETIDERGYNFAHSWQQGAYKPNPALFIEISEKDYVACTAQGYMCCSHYDKMEHALYKFVSSIGGTPQIDEDGNFQLEEGAIYKLEKV